MFGWLVFQWMLISSCAVCVGFSTGGCVGVCVCEGGGWWLVVGKVYGFRLFCFLIMCVGTAYGTPSGYVRSMPVLSLSASCVCLTFPCCGVWSLALAVLLLGSFTVCTVH